jgi:hypothetical protein
MKKKTTRKSKRETPIKSDWIGWISRRLFFQIKGFLARALALLFQFTPREKKVMCEMVR